MKFKEAIYPFVVNILTNEAENYIVRHEAAEGIANLGDESSIEILRKYIGEE